MIVKCRPQINNNNNIQFPSGCLGDNKSNKYLNPKCCLCYQWKTFKPPLGQVHPHLGRYTPTLAGTPWAGTPSWAGTPPWAGIPPSRYTPSRYTPQQCILGCGRQAGGTHPTGMHSCSINQSRFFSKNKYIR